MMDVSRIRQLLAQAPRPPEDTMVTGATQSECDAFEKRTGIFLPEDVREWLKVANGPCVGPGGLFGIQPGRSHLDIESYLNMFPSWKARKWIPIAGDGCGNYYVVPTQQEYGNGYPVLFVDTSSASDTPTFVVASDIGHFLVALLEKELGAQGWPFDASYVTKSDPKITQIKDVAMPWEAD